MALGRVSDAAGPVCGVELGVRRAEGAPSGPGNETEDTPQRLDAAFGLCEDGYIGTREKGTPMTAKYPYSQALAKSLTEKLGGLAFVLPGGDVQCDAPDGTLTVYADGAVRVRECGRTEAWPALRSAVADWGVEM
jgi:hypothetical protein